METVNGTSNRIHPLVAAASVSVMLLSLVGVAAITGVLPTSHGYNASALTAPTTGPGSANAEAKLAADKVVNPEKEKTVTASSAKPQRATRPAQSGYAQAQAPVCHNCGRIESIQAIKQEAKPTGVGMVAGAVVGGVVGNQIGGGNGKKIATVAGAVGGGYAGNEIEKHARATTTYQVRVRMEDGSLRTFPHASQPGWNVGDRVKVVNGSLTSQA